MRNINIGMWKMYFLFGVLSIISSQSGVNAKASCRKVVKDLILPPHTKLAQNSKNKGRFRDVKLVCEKGYFFARRISTTVIKCKNGVIRTNPIPKCGGCSVPRNISNGTATFSSTAVKSYVTYSCNVGFTLVGQKERRCRQRLRWSGKEPFCERNKCPAPRRLTISNGNVTSTDPFYHDLATLSFECNDGYELRGERDIVCQDKVWSGRFPYCTEKRCPRPGSPDNGRIYGNKLYIGSTFEFFCNSGFTLYGSPKRTCQADLSWSGTLSTCDDGRSHCRDPGIPIGSTKDGKTYNLGDMVKYRCKSGYRLEGSHTRTCLQNKTWSGDQPKCVDANKRVFPSLNETMEFLREGFVDSLLQTTCSGKNITCPELNPRARALNRKYKAGLDLIFVLDGSSSISKNNFKIAKGFLKTIVRIFGVSTRPDGTRIACVVFGTEANVEFSFNDHSVSTKELALERIHKIVQIRGGTATRAALDEVRKTILPSGRSKEGSTTALFLITDGNSNIGGKPLKAAQALRDKGVEIYVVGVGNEVKQQSLKDIASEGGNEEHVFTIENFKKLKEVEKWIAITSGRDYSQCGRAHFKSAVVLDNRARIVGGSNTKGKLWPWAVRIYVKGQHACGGTLINQEFVLTAAHCFDDKIIPQQVKVAFGDKDRTTYTSLKIKKHQKYDPSKLINDIALVQIPELKRYSRSIQAICLPWGFNTTHIIKPGNNLFAVGWGITKRVNKGGSGHRKDYSNELKRVEIPFINDTKCADNVDKKRAERVKHWENWYFSSDTQFCAGDISGQNDTCKGDSGGPAMVLVKEPVTNKPRWYQVGIVSWGNGCAQAGEYGYYSKVPAFLDWVDKQIKV